MKTEQHITPLLDKPKTVFTVVVYQDQVTRDRVIESCDHLITQMSDDLEFELSWWRFDYLQDEHLAAAAANDATQADIVIVAAHDGELPASVQHWMESWAHRKQNLPSALVGMVGGAEEAVEWSPGHTFLRGMAAVSGMEYLPQLSLSVFGSHPAAHDPFAEVHDRAETMTPVMEEILNFHPPYRRWGINE